jgi:hypothetical protein
MGNQCPAFDRLLLDVAGSPAAADELSRELAELLAVDRPADGSFQILAPGDLDGPAPESSVHVESMLICSFGVISGGNVELTLFGEPEASVITISKGVAIQLALSLIHCVLSCKE